MYAPASQNRTTGLSEKESPEDMAMKCEREREIGERREREGGEREKERGRERDKSIIHIHSFTMKVQRDKQ